MTEIEDLKSIINDLTLVVEMYIDNYPFDEDHKAKHRILVNEASFMIGKPRSIKELIKILNIEDKLEPGILEILKKDTHWE